MGEEIKKNPEIGDDELEQVSGGTDERDFIPIGSWNALEYYKPDCPNCKTKMRLLGSGLLYFYVCDTCNHQIDIEP